MTYEAGDPDDYWLTHDSLAAAADGATILIYAYCDGGGCGPREPRAIYRLVGGRLKRLAKVKSPAALAVGGRRFALVTNTPRCCSFTPVWSHDGKRLAWIYDGGLWTIRADGTEARQLATEGRTELVSGRRQDRLRARRCGPAARHLPGRCGRWRRAAPHGRY